MEELSKEADIYFIDEIGKRFMFSDKLQEKVVELMDDPSKLLIATIEK